MSDKIDNLRRNLLKSAGAVPALPLHGAASWLYKCAKPQAAGNTVRIASPYGVIAPVNDQTTGLPLLQLPAGFTYKSYGWRGDIMSNGKACPAAHDGMAVVTHAQGWSQHRNGPYPQPRSPAPVPDSSFFGAPAVYDLGGTAYSNGGTTNLTFRDGNFVKMEASLGGTRTNCAGGLTPWGTWLTCEEVGSDSVSSQGKKHGYVFSK